VYLSLEEAEALADAAESAEIPDKSAVRATVPGPAPPAEGLCWDSLSHGDTAAFTRQTSVGAKLRKFGLCVGLLEDE
jgi:hypothetical protein